MPLHLLHQTPTWVAIAKPPGLLTHRGPGFRDQVAAVQLLRDQLGVYVYPVHRLDRGASGVLIFATEQEQVYPLHQALQAGQKRYWALCRGAWRLPQTQTWVENPMEDDNGLIKDARTAVRLLGSDRDPRCCLLAADPESGRYHQVRRHLRDLAHPILGDNDHGDSRVNRDWRIERGLGRLALHCASVRLELPEGSLTLRCPLFEDLYAVLQPLPLWAQALSAESELGAPPLPMETA